MTSPIVVTPEVISGGFAILMSLLFTYFPLLNTWFAGKPTEVKSLIMIGGTALIAVAIFIASCYGWIATNLACSQNGVIELLKIFFLSLMANQVTYLSTKSFQPKSVVAAKAARDGVVG